MSVIAKLTPRAVAEFGTGTFVELGCIADNDLMAAYNPSQEDKLFSRYSPWGEIRLHQRAAWAVFAMNDQHVEAPGRYKAFYAVMVPIGEGSAKPARAAAAIKINCYSKTKFAGDGSRVELREVHDWRKEIEAIESSDSRYGPNGRFAVIEKLSWKMHVDNPPAEAKFVPGQNYWLAFYDADEFDMTGAWNAAHGVDAPSKTEVANGQ